MPFSSRLKGLRISARQTGLQTSPRYAGLLEFTGPADLQSRGIIDLIDALIIGLGEIKAILGLIGKLFLQAAALFAECLGAGLIVLQMKNVIRLTH